jgi:hypothetical protein
MLEPRVRHGQRFAGPFLRHFLQAEEGGSRALDAAKPLLLALALLAVALAALNGLARSLGDSPQFSFTLAGSFAIYLATRPARREVVVTVLLGLALRLAYEVMVGVPPYFGSILICFAGFLGVAGLMALAFRALRDKRYLAFGTAAFFPFVSILVGFVLVALRRLSPTTLDAHLLAADGTLGFQPSFVLGSVLLGRKSLWDLASTVYYALPFAIALLCAAQFEKNFNEVRRLLSLFIAMSVAGLALYAVCPATGPIYAFRDCYPFKPPHLTYREIGAALFVPLAPRNAMPSVHFGTALLVFWNTADLRKAGRIAAGLFLAGMAFAVLALGEHYLIDLIVAVPFCLVFQAAYTNSNPVNSRARYRAIWGSAALVAGWILMLRFCIGTVIAWPAVTCTAFVATLGFSIWARRELSLAGPVAGI